MVSAVLPRRIGFFDRIGNPFRNNSYRGSDRKATSQQRGLFALENLRYRSKGVGLIPLGMLVTTLVLFFKDLFSDLYVHALGKSYLGDKSHLNTEAELQTLDRKYLLRSALVDLPTWIMSFLSFMKHEMPIASLLIGGLWLFRNFVGNLILNKNNKALLALSEPTTSQLPPQQNYPQQPNSPPPQANPQTSQQLPPQNDDNSDLGQQPNTAFGGGVPPNNNGYGYGPGIPAGTGQGLTSAAGQPVPVNITINNAPNEERITRNG